MENDQFRPKRSIKFKVVLGLALALVTVSAVSFISYRSLSELVDTVQRASRPNRVLIDLKEVMSELSDAESSVRAYTITRNPAYLTPYYSSISEIERRMRELRGLVKEDSTQWSRVDSISILIGEKFLVLESLLHVRNDNRLESTLERISRNIEEVKGQEEAQESREKKGFLRKLLHSREDPDVDTAGEPGSHGKDPRMDAIQNIEEKVSEISEEEKEEALFQRKKELEYTRKDQMIMDQIRDLIRKMEEAEVDAYSERATEARNTAEKTKNITTGFVVIAFALLLVLGYVIINDISRSNRFRKLLSEAKAKAERLARVKDEFLANMSHEIRTPITAIIGFTEQMEKTRLSEEQEQYLKVIRNSSQHLYAIINDVLDHSKLESGTLKFEQVPFRIREVIDDVLVSFREKALEREVELREEVAEEVPEVLLGDPVRFKQVLFNLVGNALKFTEKGYVKVGANVGEQEKKRVFLEVEVEDTGVGIPEDKQDDIFENFSQLDTTSTRKYGGSGLGLTISRKLVELQGGSIDVNSTVGEGSVFTFRIPYKAGQESDLRSAESKSEQKNLGLMTGLKALVVDDEHYNRMLIKTVLQKWGMVVTDVDNGGEALKKVEERSFDLVLMDIQMPEMSGIEAARRIKKLENGAGIPVIALTAGISKEEIQRGYEAGMADHLLKPFKEDDLYNKLLQLLELGESSVVSIPGKKEEAEESAFEEDREVDLGPLYELADGDVTFVREMVGTFLRDSGETLEALEKAFDNGQVEGVGRRAHKLASPCRHLGLKALAKELKAIETHCKEEGTLEPINTRVRKVIREMEKIRGALEQKFRELEERET